MSDTVIVNSRECIVETLMQWIEFRIKQIRSSYDLDPFGVSIDNYTGRLVELEIIKEKISDGRIQGLK